MGFKNFVLPFAGSALALALAACETSPSPASDSSTGEPAADASAAPQADATRGPRDGGVLPSDAGQVPTDADATPVDAATDLDADAQVSPTDEDASVSPTEEDASVSPTDEDAGEPEPGCDDDAACEPGEYCDAADRQCKSIAPWRPDCTALPANAPCEAGPREVLLVTNAHGLIAMFDPESGEFLGNLKGQSLPLAEDDNQYSVATQGPDMCIWSTREGDSAGQVGVERWDTDGTRLGEVIPFGDDVLEDPLSLAFTEQHVYVASDGNPTPRVSRFTLDGEFVDVVLDDGSLAASVEVLADGRLVVAAPQCSADVSTGTGSCFVTSGIYGEVFVVNPETGERTTLWSDVEPRQVWYAGDGRVLSHDHSLGGALASIDVRTGERTVVAPVPSLEHSKGIAALGDGRWLVSTTEGSVLAFDPEAPTAAPEILWDDVSVLDTRAFQQVGRACVPEAVIEAARSRAGSPCPPPPEGPALLVRDFEEDEGDRFVEGGAAGSERSLRVVGNDGVRLDLPEPARPSYVGFYVQTSGFSSSDTPTLAGMVNTDAYYVEAALLQDDSLQTIRSRVQQPMATHTWVRVEFSGIDWDAQRFDLCIDGTLVAADVTMGSPGELPIDRISFGNQGADVTSWIDEVVVK